MTPASCIRMAEYNRWMNARLYDAAGSLSGELVFEERGAFFGSLFGTLNHIAVGDTIWLRRFVQLPGQDSVREALDAFPAPATLTQQLLPTLSGLRAYRDKLDGLIARFAGDVTQEQLDATLSYTNTAGQSQARNFGALVQHFFNHQTHHRGQATTLLSQFGVDVGMTDLLAVIPREE